MRATHSVVRTLITLVISGCIGGTGSGLMGIAGGDGGGTTHAAPVLTFFSQPNSANVGEIIAPDIQVAARDSLGNTDTLFTGVVNVILTANSTGAALSGTRSARAVNGIASFGNLAIDRAGTYTLQASATGATPVTSTAFSITTVTTP
ncbi:MAG: hypothetical protein ABR537_05610 [Gemmatimonadales bacterium]